ncbi:MAG: PQQ-dependent sugar dehydrogenase, partial [Halofilum sp. (in: g-proteobacteria)]
DPPTQPEFADAAMHWTPVISPSGMTFYTGAQFPEWRGSALIGSLSDQAMVRVEIEDGTAREAERLPLNQRIREVAQAPDDTIYVLTDADDGSIWRLAPGD